MTYVDKYASHEICRIIYLLQIKKLMHAQKCQNNGQTVAIFKGLTFAQYRFISFSDSLLTLPDWKQISIELQILKFGKVYWYEINESTLYSFS